MRCQADVAERVAAAPTPQAAASLREGPPDWAPDTRCARPFQDLRCVIPFHDRGRVLLCASVRRCQKCHPPRVLLRVYVTASDLSVEYNRQVQPPQREFQASFIAPRPGRANSINSNTPQTSKKTAHAGRAIRSVCDSRDSIRIAGYPRTSYLHVPRAGVPAGGPRAVVHRLHGTRRARLCTELCTAFRLMLTPPSLPSPRWRWRALPEALEEASCHGWHLRDS
jgi:hypothetical protein